MVTLKWHEMSSLGILIFFLELFSSTFWETVDFNITRHGWWIGMSWRTKWNCISKKAMLLSHWQCTLKSLPLFYFYILTQTNFYPHKRLVLDNIPVDIFQWFGFQMCQNSPKHFMGLDFYHFFRLRSFFLFFGSPNDWASRFVCISTCFSIHVYYIWKLCGSVQKNELENERREQLNAST